MTKITIKTAPMYDIIIGKNILDDAGPMLRRIMEGTAAIVTDDTVGPLYGPRLADSLEKSGFSPVTYTFLSGEASKNAATYLELLNFLAARRLTRSDVVVALGGGVVGDLAGFAASTYMRGVHFVQIPTTLLAAVDSSVGGKTAIDLDAGKNLAGTFYQPRLVLCDLTLLDTLDDEIFLDGMAEVVKYGVIADRALFQLLGKPVRPRLEEVVARCVAVKRDIVELDEREAGPRKLLNFGHTVGHAVEKCSGYTVRHGMAVAIGMAVITRAAVLSGLCRAETGRAIIRKIRETGLPDTTDISPERLYEAALSDKKRDGDSITLVLPETIGKCVLRDYKTEELARFIELGLSRKGADL